MHFLCSDPGRSAGIFVFQTFSSWFLSEDPGSHDPAATDIFEGCTRIAVVYGDCTIIEIVYGDCTKNEIVYRTFLHNGRKRFGFSMIVSNFEQH